MEESTGIDSLGRDGARRVEALAMKPGWTVVMQIQQRGKWIDPLPGMDRFEAWFATREGARVFQRWVRTSLANRRFVLRRAAR